MISKPELFLFVFFVLFVIPVGILGILLLLEKLSIWLGLNPPGETNVGEKDDTD